METLISTNQIPKNKKIKITCISDTHTKTKDLILPEGDILIHCGDFSMYGRRKEILAFNDFLKKQNFKHKIVIAGNHDIVFDKENYDYLTTKYKDSFNKKDLISHDEAKGLLKDCVYLENSGCTIMDLNIWGYPVSDTGGVEGAFVYDSKNNEEKIKSFLEKIPGNIDILVSHGPPYGILDKIHDNTNVGCKILRDYVFNKIKPRYHIFGHIHESSGVVKEKVFDKEIMFVNSAVCDLKYKPTNEIISFEI